MVICTVYLDTCVWVKMKNVCCMSGRASSYFQFRVFRSHNKILKSVRKTILNQHQTMNRILTLLFFSHLIFATRTSQSSGQDTTFKVNVQGHDKQVVCYWGTWANYRPNQGKFTPEDIDPSLCTNLIYSFAGLDPNTWSIKSLDPFMDLSEDYGLSGFKKATDLKFAYPNLKVTLAIGGWNEGSKKYSDLAKDPEKRKMFVESVVEFLHRHNFDGLDLDWEYPGNP